MSEAGDERPGAGRVGGPLADPGAAGKPRPTGGSPPGAAPPPVGRPAPAAGRFPPLRRCGDRAHARLTGPSDSRRASSRHERSPSRSYVLAALRALHLDTDLSRQDPGTYQTDGPDSTRPISRLRTRQRPHKCAQRCHFLRTVEPCSGRSAAMRAGDETCVDLDGSEGWAFESLSALGRGQWPGSSKVP